MHAFVTRDRNGDEQTWHEIEATDLDDPEVVDKIEQQIEAWLPNHVDSNGRVESYDDLLDRLEGSFQLPSGEWVNLQLPSNTDDPTYKRLRRIAQRVAKAAS